MKFIKPILAIVVVATLAFWIFNTLKENKETIEEKSNITEEIITTIPVRATIVTEIALDNSLDLTGTFEARKELNIIAESQGRITQLNIDEGQFVNKGQVVAKIDDTNIQAQLTTARASMEKAKKDLERHERLVTAGAISQVRFEEVKITYQNSLSNITTIEQQLKYSTARSPMSGVIKEMIVEQGSFASPGATIATVVDVNNLKMVVKVGESDIIRVKKGQRVEISTEVYPDKTFKGIVKLISVQADAGRKYEVEIELSNPKSTPLKPGMYGAVKITPKNNQKNMALFVVRKSIIGSVQSPTVYVVENDKTVRLQAVKVGNIEGEQVEVLEGLKEGEIVVTSGQINLTEGKKVNIINSNDISKKKSTVQLTSNQKTL